MTPITAQSDSHGKRRGEVSTTALHFRLLSQSKELVRVTIFFSEIEHLATRQKARIAYVAS